MIQILSLLIFLPKISIGFAIAHLLWNDSDLPASILKLAIGIPLGLGISASLFFIALLAGVSPDVYSWIEFWGALALVVFFLARAKFSLKERIKISRPSWQDILSAGIVFSGAGLLISAFLFYAKMHSFGFEDAWSMWNLTPRYIYRGDSAAIFLNSQFYDRFHPDYPVELSLNVAWGWFILKKETTDIPIILAFLSAITPAIVTWAALIKWKGALAGALCALVIFLTPDLPSVIGQYADPLLVLHFVSATVLLYGYLKSQDARLLILASLLASLSAWVKNEGILFIGVIVAVCLLASWKQITKQNVFKPLAVGMIFPTLIVASYKFTVGWNNDLFNSPKSSMALQIMEPSRWILISQSFIINIWHYANWPISVTLVLLIYAFLMGLDNRENKHHWLLFLIFFGQFAGYFFIYLITPHDLQTHINTSMDRLVSHLFPVLVIWFFIAFRAPNFNSAT